MLEKSSMLLPHYNARKNASIMHKSLSEKMRLSSGHYAYGSEARPFTPQIKDGIVLEYIHFQRFQHFQYRTESFNLKVRTCVFAMLKTVRLEGGLYECSLELKLIELLVILSSLFKI